MSAIKGMEGVEECVIEYDNRGREYQGMWYVCIKVLNFQKKNQFSSIFDHFSTKQT